MEVQWASRPREDLQAVDAFRCQLCRDPGLIETILTDDYFDAPVCYFPTALIRTAAQDWFCATPGIYLVTAEADGHYAGFVFGHTLGPGLWRQFARRQVQRHFGALSWVWFQTQVWQPLRGRFAKWTRPAEIREPAPLWVEDLPRLRRPFQWSPPRPGLGYVDLLFVRPAFRGRGLAPRLLQRLGHEMRNRGVEAIESHVDAANYVSLTAFRKAGWQAFRTTDGAFHLHHRP